jgi:hypothetical protein
MGIRPNSYRAQGPHVDRAAVWSILVNVPANRGAHAPYIYLRVRRCGTDCHIFPTFTAGPSDGAARGAKRRRDGGRGDLGKRLRRKREACEHEHDDK